MADFQAPTNPPPPRVPEGWVSRWNEQYKEWFYVNIFTRKSQWEKPTSPARPGEDVAPPGPPLLPSYAPSDKPAPTDVKRNPYEHTEDEDAKLARRLQDEEDARARASSGHSPNVGAAASYNAGYPGGQLAPLPGERDGKNRGLLGKIFGGKKSHGGSDFPGAVGGGHNPQPIYGPQPGYGPQSYGPPGYGGGYPAQGGYYGGPPGGYYGGGHPQQAHHAQPGRTGGGMGGIGMGLAGGAALGLAGGMLMENAIHDHDQDIYQQGYENGEMADDGGGDFGGDF